MFSKPPWPPTPPCPATPPVPEDELVVPPVPPVPLVVVVELLEVPVPDSSMPQLRANATTPPAAQMSSIACRE